MAKRISQEKQDEIFAAYCDLPSTYYVARTCAVSATTVRKYRDRNNWVERRERMLQEAERRSEKTMAARLVRWAKHGQALQEIGKSKFFDEQDKLKPSVIKEMTPADAIRAIETGVKIENEAAGEPSERTERKLIVEFVTPDGGIKKLEDRDEV